MLQCNEAKTVGIETREAKRKNGEAREAEQGEEENDGIEEENEGDEEEESGRNARRGNEREQYARRKHLRVLLSIIYRSAPCAGSLPFGITIYAARCIFDR